MRAGYIKSLWLWTYGVLLTANVCFLAVVKSFFGPLKREWIIAKLQKWVDRLSKSIDMPIKVHNPHQISIDEKKPTIIMTNHASLLDIPISFYVFPKTSIRMLAKKELSRIPIMARAMKKAEFPFIDRKNREQAIKDLAYAKKLMETGVVLWIAPEGTRSKDGKLHSFKKGGFITAIQAQAQIIPLMIENAHEVMGKNQFRVNTHTTVHAHIGKPIDAKDYTLENKEALMTKVRQEMLTVLKEA